MKKPTGVQLINGLVPALPRAGERSGGAPSAVAVRKYPIGSVAADRVALREAAPHSVRSKV